MTANQQNEFVYILNIGNGSDSMFMGVFKTKKSAEIYAKRNKEDIDGLYFYYHQGLTLVEEKIEPCQGLGEFWIIRETVLQP